MRTPRARVADPWLYEVELSRVLASGVAVLRFKAMTTGTFLRMAAADGSIAMTGIFVSDCCDSRLSEDEIAKLPMVDANAINEIMSDMIGEDNEGGGGKWNPEARVYTLGQPVTFGLRSSDAGPGEQMIIKQLRFRDADAVTFRQAGPYNQAPAGQERALAFLRVWGEIVGNEDLPITRAFGESLMVRDFMFIRDRIMSTIAGNASSWRRRA